MIARGQHARTLTALAAAVTLALFAGRAHAQSCPLPLMSSNRLVLVTAETMDTPVAAVQLFQRAAPGGRWQALGPPEPAMIGRAGMGWSQFFKHLARAGEPVKVESDKRAPAGVYSIGRSFGTLASSRPNYLHVKPGLTCVDDTSSPAYNTIASRAELGPKVHGENMSQALPMYRRGLLVDYPTDAKRRAGSCIFIHVWRSPTTGTAGCVAVPEPRMEALQDFAEGGAVLAILPRQALDRLRGCLPDVATKPN